MYHYLKDKGLFPLIHRNSKTRGKTYHIEFVEDKYKDKKIYAIKTDWGYIRGFDSIHLCANEVVIVSDYGFAKINMYYKNINTFEVLFDDDDLTGLYKWSK
jgi:hypothetical protein